MQCPKCQAEVSEWHFYCQNCHTQIQSYNPEMEKPSRGGFERAGARAINALIWVVIISVLVLTGRAVQWGEFFDSIRRATGVFADSEKESEARLRSRKRSDGNHRNDTAQNSQKIAEASRQEKNDAVESVREMPQKIEELPSAEDQPQSAKPSEADVKDGRSPAVAAPGSISQPAIRTAPSATVDAQLGIEQIDGKNSDQTGLVAINSYTPARIYINGQFSGTTPRTVKLIAGDHQIRLIADGYEDWNRRVRLRTKQQVEIMASMKKKGAQ